MPGLVDSGIGYVQIRKIDHGIALVVVGINRLLIKPQCPPAEFSIFIVEKAIDRAAINQTRIGIQLAFQREIIRIQKHPYSRVCEEPVKDRRVAVDGDTLPGIGEIAVIVIFPDRYPVENRGRKLTWIRLPLFDRIWAEEGFIKPASQ